MKQFEKSVWIWREGQAGKDEFVDFVDTFSRDGDAPVTLHIAADSNYSVWLNGELAAFGQYADYPFYKVYDTVDLTHLCRQGQNRLAITVWYYGEGFQTYAPGEAGLIYEILSAETVLAASTPCVHARISPASR